MSENMPLQSSGKAFATNLKRLRKAHGLTQEELGKALGVQKSCISNYEQNFSMPDISRLLEIASFFEITDLGQLVGYNPPLALNDSGSPNRNVPVVHKIEYGKPPVRKDNIIDDFVLPSINIRSGEFLGFIIPDNSMIKSVLKKGDIAVVRQQNIVSSGDIALVALENKPPVIRKIFIIDNNTVMLMADCDDSSYVPITLDPRRDNFEIIGRIVYVQLTF